MFAIIVSCVDVLFWTRMLVERHVAQKRFSKIKTWKTWKQKFLKNYYIAVLQNTAQPWAQFVGYVSLSFSPHLFIVSYTSDTERPYIQPLSSCQIIEEQDSGSVYISEQFQ